MKTILLSLLTFLIAYNITIAQEENKKHSFGFHFKPNFTSQVFENKERGEGSNLFGMSFGLDYFYKVSSQISIKAGVAYNLIRIDQKDFTPNFGCDFFSNEVVLMNSWFEDQYKIHLLGIPLEVLYSLGGNRNHWYVKLGTEVQIKIKEERNSHVVECQNIPREIDLEPFQDLMDLNIPINLGFGYQLKMSDNIDLYFEPEIGYAINKVLKKQTFNNSRLLNWGILIGMKL